MNITLSPQLKGYTKTKVGEGLYKSVSDVVGGALRGLMERDRLLREIAGGPRPAASKPRGRGIPGLGGAGSDIEAMAFTVLMEAVMGMDEDLELIMADVKALTAAKAALRDLIKLANADVASNAGQANGRPPLDLKSGMGSRKAYHKAPMPYADPLSKGGVKFVPTDLIRGEILYISQLAAVVDGLKDRLDSLNEVSEMASLRLQMAMDRRSKLIGTLSNVLKKISDTGDSVVQNLK
jgi:hypothetical protein